MLGFGLAAHWRAGTAQPLSPPAENTGVGLGGSGNADPSSLAAAVAAKVDPGVVDINTTLGYQGGMAAGTGMVISPSGEVLTNNHVIDGATGIRVTVVTTGRTYSAEVLGTDRTADVAVLKLKGASGLKTVSLGDSSKLAHGTTVVAIGNALGQGGTPSVVVGTVLALNQSITASDPNGSNAEQLNSLIQTSATLAPGDSGGPLATTDGKVVGMDTAATSSFRFRVSGGVSFAIPINAALSIARQITAGQASSTVHIGASPFLGVEVQTSGGSGALVVGVLPGTPAAGAGIVPGDAIASVDGKSVDSGPSLTSILGSHHPGDKLTLGWFDGAGQSHTATVTLAAGPAK
jgi:S1-C subfamily serine protease